MITQAENLNSSARPVEAVRPAAGVNHNSSADNASPDNVSVGDGYSKDVVTISDNGNIDYTLFNYLNKGGEASKALGKGVSGEDTSDDKASENDVFKPVPNFSGMGITRYNQMKSEIERDFSDDPDLKSKYLKELDKTLEDYIRLQVKIADSRANTENGPEDAEAENEEITKLKSLFSGDSGELKAIIEKVLGENNGIVPDEVSKEIDDYFIEVYRQRTNAPKKYNIFNQEIQEDPKTKDIWNSVRMSIDSTE